MKKILELKLKILAKLIIWRYKPRIVAITGSVGKTSARDAIRTALTTHFRVNQGLKNYNNEIGLPLTIIGSDSPGKNPIGWLGVFVRALKLIIFKDNSYPQILVLEMGVDRPGDMAYLNSIARPDIGVVTAISHSHLEYFGTIDNIAREKSVLIKNLKKGGTAILNFDDEKVRAMKDLSQMKVFSYGLRKGADLVAEDLDFSRGLGLQFKMNYQGAVVPVQISGVISQAAVYSSLAATLVGLALGLNLIQIAQSLRALHLPPGRMNIIPGIKKTTIIDDSYNASPDSCFSALDSLERVRVEGGRKIAVLGDMLELGSYTVEGHRAVGKKVAEANIAQLILVGERARDIGRGAQEQGFSKDQIFNFNTSQEAAPFVQERMRAGDLLLIKGSQGARMEVVVKEIMAEPLRAKELLVRQGPQWN